MPTRRQEQGDDAQAAKRAGCATSRRGLVAAAAIVAAALATQKARAFELPPRDRRRDPRCFLRGTRIRAAGGDIPVEALAVGDLVQTFDGTSKPIRWIGRQVIERRPDGAWHGDVAPVRVARSALGPLVPEQDLFLSPAHALYIDGVLVPVRNLINGRTISQVAVEGETIEYFHIQLAGHDVVFAEGAPAETLLTACDPAVQGWNETMLWRLPPNDERMTPYAPMLSAHGAGILRSRLRSAIAPLVDRRQPVDIIWERIAERAETELSA